MARGRTPIRRPHEVIKGRMSWPTREIEMRRPSSLAGTLFDYQIPRFAFSASQQRLLLAAFGGCTDEEMSVWLGNLDVCSKKHQSIAWRRDARTFSTKFCRAGRRAGADAERKCRLLTYLRDHPEEQRPISRKASAGRHRRRNTPASHRIRRLSGCTRGISAHIVANSLSARARAQAWPCLHALRAFQCIA